LVAVLVARAHKAVLVEAQAAVQVGLALAAMDVARVHLGKVVTAALLAVLITVAVAVAVRVLLVATEPQEVTVVMAISG
jgi:hypothetical protein